MGVIWLHHDQPIIARSLPDHAVDSLEHWSWVGIGVLLGFLFVSLVLGALERLRGNPIRILEEKNGEINGYKATIVQKDAKIAQKDTTIAQKDAIIAQSDTIIARNDATITTLNEAITAQKRAIDTKNEIIATKTRIIDEKDRLLAQKDADLEELRQAKSRIEHELDQANRRVRDLESRINDMNTAESARQVVISDLETRVADLSLARNRLTNDLNGAQRTTRDQERDIARQDRMINFLQQMLADVNDGREDEDDEETTGTSIQDREISRLVTGLQEILHRQGPCDHMQSDVVRAASLDRNVRNTPNLMDRLNGAMPRQVVTLVLDIMGHLGIGQ